MTVCVSLLLFFYFSLLCVHGVLQTELMRMQELLQESEHLREDMEASRIELRGKMKQLIEEKAGLQHQLAEQACSTEVGCQS